MMRQLVWWQCIVSLAGSLAAAAVLIVKPKAKGICEKYQNGIYFQGRVVQRQKMLMKIIDTGKERSIYYLIVEYIYPDAIDGVKPVPIRKKVGVKEEDFESFGVGSIVDLYCIAGRPKSALKQGSLEFSEKHFGITDNTFWQLLRGLSLSFAFCIWLLWVFHRDLNTIVVIALASYSAVMLVSSIIFVWWKIPTEDRLMEVFHFEKCLDDEDDPENPSTGTDFSNMFEPGSKTIPLLSTGAFV